MFQVHFPSTLFKNKLQKRCFTIISDTSIDIIMSIGIDITMKLSKGKNTPNNKGNFLKTKTVE